MYARKGTLYPDPDRFDFVLQLLHDTVAPAAERVPGFSSMLIMNNRRTNKIVAITLWESETDMRASETSEYLQEQVHSSPEEAA